MRQMWVGTAVVACLALGSPEHVSGDQPISFSTDGVECVPIQKNIFSDHRTGRVKVMEVFSYGCKHCFHMEPYIAKWLKSKPDYVDFIRVHVPGHGATGSYARLYYTLQALGRLDLQSPIFTSIFEDAHTLSAQSEDEAFKIQLAFVTEHGMDPGLFTDTYRSLPISQELQRAFDVLRTYQVDVTPTLVVNGKYRITMTKQDRQEDLMAVLSNVTAYLHEHP